MSAGASATIYVPISRLKPALEAAWELAKLPGVPQETRGTIVLPGGEKLPTPYAVQWLASDRETLPEIRPDGAALDLSFQFWGPRPEDSEWMELDRIKVKGVRCFRFGASMYVEAGAEFASISVSVDGSEETMTFAQESSLVRLSGIASRGESTGAIVNIDGGLSLRDGDFDFVSDTDFFPDNVQGVDNQARAVAILLAES